MTDASIKAGIRISGVPLPPFLAASLERLVQGYGGADASPNAYLDVKLVEELSASKC